MKQKYYTISVVARRKLTIRANSPEEAEAVAEGMRFHGDGRVEVEDCDVVFEDIHESDENGNKMLGIFLFCDDETATIWELPVAFVPENTAEISDEILREIVKSTLSQDDSNSQYVELADSWDRAKLTNAMWDLGGVIFDSAALVPSSDWEYLSQLGETLSKDFGCDSTTYRACAMFNEALKRSALKIIEFPAPNTELDINYGGSE